MPNINAIVVPITVKKLLTPQAQGIICVLFCKCANPVGNGMPNIKPKGNILTAAMNNLSSSDKCKVALNNTGIKK